MGVTKDGIKRRMERLAQRKGLCPKHMAPLWCVFESEWLATAEEWAELGELIHRLEPDIPMPSAGVPCPQCKEQLYCLSCGMDFYATVPEREYDLNPEELARYQELIHLLRATPGAHHDKDFFRALSRQPPEPPAPIPIPVPTPAVSIPIPVPVVDADDDDIDTELAEIVAAIKRRLAK